MKKGIRILVFIVWMIAAFGAVHLFRIYFPEVPDYEIGGFFGAFILTFWVHVILHETGHLLFGKLSGYQFVSFRVFGQTLVKQNGKLVRKKFKGWIGQALMLPPDMKNGTFPSVLYNLGGGLMNFLFGALFLGLFFIASPFWRFLLLAGAISGILAGLISIVPQKPGGLPNDGYNALLLGRKGNADIRHAFWVQLHFNTALASGTRPRDIPTAWFEWVTPDNWNDPMVAAVAVIHYEYLLDRLELNEARSLAQTLLDTADKMLGTHKNQLRCELLFHELINECRPEEVGRIYTKELQAYIETTPLYTSNQRMLYAYARLFTKDAAQTEAHWVLFLEACKSSARLGEIPGEKELVALVDRIAEGRNADLLATIP